jgi:hypothetical protein
MIIKTKKNPLIRFQGTPETKTKATEHIQKAKKVFEETVDTYKPKLSLESKKQTNADKITDSIKCGFFVATATAGIGLIPICHPLLFAAPFTGLIAFIINYFAKLIF